MCHHKTVRLDSNGHCKSCKRNEYNRKWRANNPELMLAQKQRYNDRAYELNIQRKYGLSLGDYNAIKTSQNDLCAICKRDAKLSVDHCHTTKKVRQLLCANCNRGLGLFKDNPTLLRVAAFYIEVHRDSN